MKHSTAEDGLKKSDLLFQPALANISENDLSTLKKQICSICNLEIEEGKFFEHLARAHSKKKNPAIPEQIHSKVTENPKNINHPEIVVTAASLKLINQGKDPIVNPVGLIFNKERTPPKPRTLDEKIEAYKIKPCEIKLTKCDHLINCAQLTFNSVRVKKSKMPEQVTKEKSKGKMDFTSKTGKLHLCSYPGCGKRFASRTHLEIHYRIHTGEKPFQCKVCLKRFNQACYLPVHSRIHTGDKPFQCKTCFKRFTQSYTLTIHVKGVHGKSTSRASVQKMQKENKKLFKNMASIENIKYINEPETAVTAVSLELINNDSNVTALSLEEKIKASNVKPCEIKLTKCDDLINCADHPNISLRTNSKIQGKVTRENSKGKTDSAKQISKLHLCAYPKCEKYFKSNYQLEIHSRVHSGEKPYKCKVCCRRFTQQSSLNRHSRMHTEGKKSLKWTSQPSNALEQRLSRVGKTVRDRKLHKCSFPGCNKAFTGLGNLQIHYRIHTGERPFQCKVCLKRFNQSSYLTVHSRIHTGDKPFQCKTCFKRFTQSGSLIKHVKNVHGKRNSRTSVRKIQNGSKSLFRITAGIKPSINSRSQPQKKVSSSKVKLSKGGAYLVNQSQTKSLVKVPQSGLNPGKNVFACLGCSKRDASLSNLELHIKQAHGLELGANFDRTLLLCKTSN